MREFRSRLTVVLLFFASYHTTTAHIRVNAPEEHNVPKYRPSFIRSAIENVPEDSSLEPFSRFSLAPTFGEIFLPLRSAVESVPTISTRSVTDLQQSSSLRHFVRDAVEAIPADENDDYIPEEEYSASIRDSLIEEAMPETQSGLDFEVETFQGVDLRPMPADKYDAYAIPDKNHGNVVPLLPQPFRSDSPYQQLVKASELSDSDKVEDITKVRDKISGYGALSPVHYRQRDDENIEDHRPYGALAQFKDPKPPHKNYNHSPEVLCYITNWAFYRKADGQFVPEYLKNTHLCTKLIYSFASLDPDHLNIREFDPWVDIENQFYNRMVETGIPVLIAMGGWTDSFGDKYSRLASDDIKRKVFASNLVGFLQRHGFSGLHLDWNYPKCWQSDCTKGPASDKPNLTKLLREIRTEFERVDQKLKLGVAISGYKEIISQAYEFPELSKIVDYMTVMSYDYHGAWEGQTGHVSPLYGRKGDKYPQYNTDYTMQLLLKLGAKKESVIMGIPFYGQTFTLEYDSLKLVGEGTTTIGPGEAGEFTKQPGMLAYYEICQRIRKQKWLTGRDSERKSGPYAMFRNQWVGYEDPASVEAKARYAVNSGFGGVAAWTVDLDDFQNRCCSETFPLLKAINRALGRDKSEPPTRANCSKPPAPITPMPPAMTTISSDGSWGGGSGGHEHTTANPVWQPSTTTTTTPRTSTIWWTPPSTTTTTTYTSTTSKRPIVTQKPTQPAQKPTTIPAPAVVRPVIQASNCVPGEFYPDPYNCNSYYQCIVAGEIRQQFCPGGLHWNTHDKNCDWPASAKCTAKKKPLAASVTTKIPSRQTPAVGITIPRKTTQTPPRHTTNSLYWYNTRPSKPITTTVHPNKPHRPFVSARCNEGEYYTHRNCGKYYICINGVLVPNSCGSNLHWDGVKKICDWPENVKCVTTKKYLRIIQSKSNPEDPCNGEERVPYPGDCTKYLFCLWNRLQAADCGPGLHFNAATGQCDWPKAAKCNNEPTGGDTNNIHPPKPKPAPTTPKPTTTSMRPTYPTDKPVLQPLDGYFKVVCYFTNWAWYRKGLGRYTPDDINTDLCTHIVYGFAVLDYSELTLRTHDSWADIDNSFYTRVSDLKRKGVKVSLALGGWNDSQGDKYSRLVRSPQARSRFVKHSLTFLEKYGFEGLDLDWEYPVCWQTDCKKGMADEKEGFTYLVRELSEAFVPRGLLLSTAVSPSKKIIDAGYDVPQLSRYFDWIAVMTYDFHGQWDKKTGHVAPLFYHPEDDYDYFNANYSLNYWIEKGAPSRKIVMGMPLYGQSFTLENERSNGLNAKAPGPGKAGEFTRAAGFLAYYEICDRINHQGWEVVQDKRGRMGPFARKGNQWVSFDDKAMIRKKSQLIRAMDLGGGMVWALDLDDFRNRCGEGVHPLLSQIHDVLKYPPTGNEPTPGLEPSTEPESMEEVVNSQEIIYPMEIETQQGGNQQNHLPIGTENVLDHNNNVDENNFEIITPSQESSEESISSGDFKVVCYFTNWAWYRQGGGKFLPEDINADLCSHIVYGFAVLNRETLTIQPHDSWADLDNKFYERVASYRKKGIKVTVAIGGWNDSAGDKYARLVRSLNARTRFIGHVMDFIEKYGFEGLDLDWEYPVCWQVDCKKGDPDEKEGFAILVKELSLAFKPKGLLLSAAVSPNKKVIDVGYDVPKLSKYFDWIAVMAYDYHGQWDKKTGHVAPMYDHPEGTEGFNANFSINYWLEKGADRNKLIMGMPMYGQSFSLADAKNHGLNAQTYGGGEAGEATRARGFLSYYEICSYIRNKDWMVVRDACGRMGPYAYRGDQWVSFDDTLMIRHKAEYVKAMGLGGAMIWALDLDDFKNDCNCESYPLLKAINRVLRNYPGPHPQCKLESQKNLFVAGADSIPMGQPKPKPGTNTHIVSQQMQTKPTKPIQAPVKIECSNGDYAPHENDCNKYYICQYGEFVERKCPSGLYWRENYCDWPQAVNCTVRYDQTTQRSVTVKPKPTKPFTSKDPTKSTKKPITSIHKKPIPPNEQYKVVCYFTNWAWYRPGQGKYLPEDIDENLCTHIVYGFAVLNSNSLTIKTHDSWADIDNHFYERVVAYKNKGLRVTVAIGGWNDSLGSKYARLVLDPQARKRFIESVLAFCEKYGFEGLDLDWEYPVCWQVDCSKGSSAEKVAFASLVRELSAAFKPKGFLLSAAVSPSKMVVDAGYDVPTLVRYFDWIAVMTYDFHGHWDKQTGHVAPLYYIEGDANPFFNGNYSINYWIEKGAPPEKLVMGMPLYGQSFSLADDNARSLNDKSIGPGRAGTYTRASGFLAYYEICEQISNGNWKVVRDSKGRIGPYAYNGNQWVSYDDVNDIRRKSQFIRKMRLGGGMVWALDLDDFRGRCGCGKHPLLRTLNQELRGIPGQRAYDCT